MTPKEKAIEIFNNFYMVSSWIRTEEAKRCALIAVDEIFQLDVPGYPTQSDYDIFINYWDEVKQEIEKI